MKKRPLQDIQATARGAYREIEPGILEFLMGTVTNALKKKIDGRTEGSDGNIDYTLKHHVDYAYNLERSQRALGTIASQGLEAVNRLDLESLLYLGKSSFLEEAFASIKIFVEMYETELNKTLRQLPPADKSDVIREEQVRLYRETGWRRKHKRDGNTNPGCELS